MRLINTMRPGTNKIWVWYHVLSQLARVQHLWQPKSPKYGPKTPLRGNDNPAKRPEVRAKISESMKLRWQIPKYRASMTGIGNPFHGRTHSDTVKKNLSDISRDRLTRLWRDPERAQAMCNAQGRRPTSIEKTFTDICNKYNLPYKYVGDGDVWIHGMNPDFININGEKEVVEIWGSHWHNDIDTTDRIAKFKYHGFHCIGIWDKELSDETAVLSKLGVT